MENLNITNPHDITKGDFLEKAEVMGYSVYDASKIKAYAEKRKELIEKAERAELSEEETDTLATMSAELESLSKAVVINNDLKKEILFYRKSVNKENQTEN